FVRVYMTDENAGDSYDMRFAAWNVNRLAKADKNWFTDYATAYQLSGAVLGLNADAAAAYARNFADNNVSPGLPLSPYIDPLNPNGPRLARFVPGSPEYNNALATVISNPDLTQGAKFIDESKLYHSDVNYNFKELIKIAEIQVGGSARQYVMDSKGTIFTDFDGPIKYEEYGVYTQVQKKFMKEERLKFTGSVRYDKSQNFDGFVSPRIAFVYSAGANKQHNIRASYQTGFRNPTTQDQYIGLDLGPFALIGSAPDNLTRYVETLPVSPNGQLLPDVGETATLSGVQAYNNSFTLASVQAYSASGDVSVLQVADIGLVKPERVQAFELGYRSVVKDLSIDLNGYYNIYNDFLNQARVITPYYGSVTDVTPTSESVQAIQNGDRRVYQIYTNSKTEVTSVGFGVGLSKKVYKNFELGVNYNYADFDFDQAEDPSFVPGFNTPKHRVKASFGNPNAFKNFGFNVNVRYNKDYLYQGSFADGTVPENTVLDAQINYAIPQWKMLFKLGAANLFGEDYIQVIGAGEIGQQWFASITINP
ncbi:MAG TPA: TonB-dependent receptor, partial [Flavobacterium sp.]|nr:TonB-dependent receptor [Flavobacterium sp.]